MRFRLFFFLCIVFFQVGTLSISDAIATPASFGHKACSLAQVARNLNASNEARMPLPARTIGDQDNLGFFEERAFSRRVNQERDQEILLALHHLRLFDARQVRVLSAAEFERMRLTPEQIQHLREEGLLHGVHERRVLQYGGPVSIDVQGDTAFIQIGSRHYQVPWNAQSQSARAFARSIPAPQLNWEARLGGSPVRLPYGSTWSSEGLFWNFSYHGKECSVTLGDSQTGQILPALTDVRLRNPNSRNIPVFSPDGRVVLIESNLRTVATSAGTQHFETSASDIRTGRVISRLSGPVKTDTAHFSEDGRYIAAGSSGTQVNVWDTQTGNVLSSFPERGPDFIHRLSPDGHLIFFGSRSGETIEVRNVHDGRVVRSFPAPSQNERLVDMLSSPDGRSVSLFWSGNRVSIMDVATGRLSVATTVSGGRSGLSFSRNSRVVTVRNADTIEVFDTQMGRKSVRSLPYGPNQHETIVRSRFSRDGRYLYELHISGRGRQPPHPDPEYGNVWDMESLRIVSTFYIRNTTNAAFLEDSRGVMSVVAHREAKWVVSPFEHRIGIEDLDPHPERYRDAADREVEGLLTQPELDIPEAERNLDDHLRGRPPLGR